MLKIIDELTMPGHPARPNEDAYKYGDTFAVVFDGATALGTALLPGASDPAWVAQTGAELVAAHKAQKKCGRELLRAVLDELESRFRNERLRAPKETYEIPCAAMMLVEEIEGELLQALSFADCCLFAKRPHQTVETIGGDFTARASEGADAAKLAASAGVSPAGNLHRPDFLSAERAARNLNNTDEGQWVFAPDRQAANRARLNILTAPAGTMLLLASDGFHCLASQYGRYDAESLVIAAKDRGLHSLLTELREFEDADPNGEKFARFKKSDDATALLLEIA
jgi:hypothetical protein